MLTLRTRVARRAAHAVARSVLLAVAALLVGTPLSAQAQAAVSGVEWVSYQLVGSQRVDRTHSDFVYRVVVRNTTTSHGADLVGQVTSTSVATIVVGGSATFGDIPAQSNGLSVDTITIRQDRTQAFNPAAMNWTFSGYLVAGAVLPPDPGPAGGLTLQGVDSNGNDVRDDLERLILTQHQQGDRRNVLFEYARLFGQALEATDAASAKAVKRLQIQNQGCASVTFLENSETATLALLARGLNTIDRARRYFDYDTLTAGLYALPPRPVSAAQCATGPY